MVERWGPDFYKKTHLSGGSAGTIFAIGIALGKSPKYLDELYREVAERSEKHGPVHNASVFMEDSMKVLTRDPLTYKKLEGRCCFGTTEFFSKHRWHVSFTDNEDLISCVKSSFHIPFYCQHNRGVKGVHVVDGAYGFSGLDLPHGDATLYVGIDPHAEITRTFTYAQMFFPATGQVYEDMVSSGYEAFSRWDGRTFIKKVGHRTPNYSALYVLWALKLLEVLLYFLVDLLRFLFSAVLRMCGVSTSLEE